MTNVRSSDTGDTSLTREVLYAARYYLGNRWVLIGLGGLAVILGLSFGGWGWLVAAGLAPLILGTLPCLVMCGLGFCMMCRSGKKETAASTGAVDPAASASALGTAKIEALPAAGSSCCHDDIRGNSANALADDSTAQPKEKSDA